MKKHHNVKNANLKIYRRPYPNAADPDYFRNKLVDVVLSLVSTLGVITIFFFMTTL